MTDIGLFCQQVDKYVTSHMNTLIAEGCEKDAAILRAEAKRYIMIAKQCLKDIDIINEQLDHQASMFKQLQGYLQSKKTTFSENDFVGEMSDVYRQYNMTKQATTAFLSGEIPKTLYKATFDFQKILLNFLNINMETIIVYRTRNGIKVYSINAEDLLQFGRSGKGGFGARFPASASAMEKQLKALGKDIKDFEFLFDDEQLLVKEKADKLYKEVLYRYNSSFKGDTPRVVLWWWDNGPTDYNNPSAMYVTSTGDLTEAYAAILLSQKKKMEFYSNMEQNIDIFMRNYVADVDNVSGLLQGDIAEGIRDTQFAIKSAGASAMGLSQIIDLATEINNSMGSFTIESLKQKADLLSSKKASERNKILEKDILDNIRQLHAQHKTGKAHMNINI